MSEKSFQLQTHDRVRYQKPYGGFAGRNGWTGTVTSVNPKTHQFVVRWDQKPHDPTTYSWPAFNPTLLNVEGATSEMMDEEDGYIFKLVGDAPQVERMVVCGEFGGNLEVAWGEEAALELAKKKAAASESGQKYLILRAYRSVQREDPPLRVEEIR